MARGAGECAGVGLWANAAICLRSSGTTALALGHSRRSAVAALKRAERAVAINDSGDWCCGSDLYARVSALKRNRAVGTLAVAADGRSAECAFVNLAGH